MKAFVLTLLTGSLIASESDMPQDPKVKDHYFYGSFNLGPVPFPIPGFGVGYRTQHDHFGLDTHLQLTTIGYGSQLKYQAMGLYYFKPKKTSQFYTGLGASSSILFLKANLKKNIWIASPEWSFGKAYLNENQERRYLELQVSFPTFGLAEYKDKKAWYFPLCVFSYGIGF